MQLLDPEDYESTDITENEDFAALHLSRIKRLPKLSASEERELLERWVKFKDQKARDRVIEGRLREVPPMAKNTARKFGFQPTSPATTEAWTGYREVILDLTAAGNFGLVNAIEHYSLGQPFEHYARRCIKNEIVRHAKELRSSVHRPYGTPAPFDNSIANPDLIDMRDYCGSRANAKGTRTNLRPPPEPEIMEREALADIDWDRLTPRERCVLDARLFGFTYQEIADELQIGVTTAWRSEQQAVTKLAGVSI